MEFECTLIANDLVIRECLLILELYSLVRDYLLALRHEVVLEVQLLELCNCETQIHVVCINCPIQLLQVDAAFPVATVCDYTKGVFL